MFNHGLLPLDADFYDFGQIGGFYLGSATYTPTYISQL